MARSPGVTAVVCCTSLLFVFATCEAVQMVPLKLIHELPATNGIISNNLPGMDEKEDKLQLRMKPANFSGPEHLKSLRGRCFKHRDSKYEYEFCPFDNITQEEIESYYDPYKGVLGVWSDWVIEDNMFRAMNMIEGSSCGAKDTRSTVVHLVCGKKSALLSVEEPEKCRYLAKFASVEMCGQNAMVVYPRVTQSLRHIWDEAEQERHDGILTDKGYHKVLQRIFEVSGFYLTPTQRTSLLKKASVESALTCNAKLTAALLKIRRLEEELNARMLQEEDDHL